MVDRMHMEEQDAKSAGGAAAPPGADSRQRALFADLFVAHTPAFRAIAAGVLGRPQGIDDVLQEAAAIALAKFDDFERGTSFAAWMGQIVRFTALNAARRARRAAPSGARGDRLAAVESPAQPHEKHPPSIDDRGRLTCGAEEFDDAVLRALGQLDETARTCLLLRVLNDTPYREISLLLDIPQGTAMSHVHRARRSLREILESHADYAATPPPKGDAHRQRSP